MRPAWHLAQGPIDQPQVDVHVLANHADDQVALYVRNVPGPPERKSHMLL